MCSWMQNFRGDDPPKHPALVTTPHARTWEKNLRTKRKLGKIWQEIGQFPVRFFSVVGFSSHFLGRAEGQELGQPGGVFTRGAPKQSDFNQTLSWVDLDSFPLRGIWPRPPWPSLRLIRSMDSEGDSTSKNKERPELGGCSSERMEGLHSGPLRFSGPEKGSVRRSLFTGGISGISTIAQSLESVEHGQILGVLWNLWKEISKFSRISVDFSGKRPLFLKTPFSEPEFQKTWYT